MKKTVIYKHSFGENVFWFCFSKKQAKKRAVKKLKKEMPGLPFPIRGVSYNEPFTANTYDDLIEEIF